MKQLISDVENVILNEDKLILVLVLAEDCHEHQTGLEHELQPLIQKCQIPIKVLRVCFDINDMPWPRPMTECLYYFKPKHLKPILLRSGIEIIQRFEEDIVITSKMMNGSSYTEAAFKQDEIDLIEKTEKMFDFEKSNELPSTGKMLRNFAKDMWKSAKSAGKGLPVLVSADVAIERFNICEQCPNLTENFRCTECGCFMKKKTQLAASSCPIGKWETVQ